jgi:hypothetical protein
MRGGEETVGRLFFFFFFWVSIYIPQQLHKGQDAGHIQSIYS